MFEKCIHANSVNLITKIIMMKKIVFFILGCVMLFSCKKDKKDDADLVKEYALAGTYIAQITPSFMGTTPMASGEQTIYIEDAGDGKIRLQYNKFREQGMPFEMTVDITMTVKRGSANTLVLEGKNGLFRADPPDGGSINPDDIMPGIQLPDGAEAGMISNNAIITGLYGEIEKDGIKMPRFDLVLTPGLPLPVQISIYTKQKTN